MYSAVARRAILASNALVLLQLCLSVVEWSISRWPTQIGMIFQLPASTQLVHSTRFPTLTVHLCIKTVEFNQFSIDIEAFRMEFTFPGFSQTHRPLVYYCPRSILAPGYERATMEPSMREEVMAWAMGKGRMNTLMLEHGKNLLIKMRALLQQLPTMAFNLQLPPQTQIGAVQTTRISGLGESNISLVDANTIGFTVSTDEGYSISYDYPQGHVPLPTDLKGRLLALYRDSR